MRSIISIGGSGKLGIAGAEKLAARAFQQIVLVETAWENSVISALSSVGILLFIPSITGLGQQGKGAAPGAGYWEIGLKSAPFRGAIYPIANGKGAWT